MNTSPKDINTNRLYAEYILSAYDYKNIPKYNCIEICVMGRSNVGKSSFINHVFSNNNLARVSKRPGMTTFANFYRVSDGSIWVDLPGYGYAERTKKERIRWAKLINEYCEKREELKGIIWLLDIRHPGLEIDKQAFNWIISLNLFFLPILTKSDKLSWQERIKNKELFIKIFEFNTEPILYSIRDNNAKEVFYNRYNLWRQTISGQV
jgi:GTP-binding protein